MTVIFKNYRRFLRDMIQLTALAGLPKDELDSMLCMYVGDSNGVLITELKSMRYDFHSLLHSKQPIPAALREECRFALNMNPNYSAFMFVPVDDNGFPSHKAYIVMGR